MGNNRLIILLLQEALKAQLDLRLHRRMSPELLLVPSLQKNLIFIIILLNQSIRVRLGNRVHRLHNLIHRIRVNLPAKLDLRLNLVPVRHSHISHIVRHTHHADMRRLHHTHSGAHPRSKLPLHALIRPVADNHLSLNSHAAHNMPILPAAMRRLVLIHKIHVNRVVGNLTVKLRM